MIFGIISYFHEGVKSRTLSPLLGASLATAKTSSSYHQCHPTLGPPCSSALSV